MRFPSQEKLDFPQPRFLCIGAQKAGTTWLYQQLRTHPDFWFPPIKELHFFDYHYTPHNRQWVPRMIKNATEREINREAKHERVSYIAKITAPLLSEQWYRAMFGARHAAGRICGDITPAYSMIDREGVEYAKRLLPDTKVLFIIRDPFTRAMSEARMMFTRPNRPEGRTLFGPNNDIKGLLARSSYSVSVSRWREVFGDNIHFVAFKRIATEPLSVLAEIEKLNGARSWNYPKAQEAVYSSKTVEIPSDISEYVQKELEPERDFIVREFGAEFAAMT